MEKTTRDIPDEVYDRARDLQDSGLYEAAFEHIAAWARNEALREAAVAVEWRFNISQAAVGRAIHDHAEGEA